MSPLFLRLEQHWQKRNVVTVALWLFSLLFGALVYLRQRLYHSGFLRRHRGRLPLIVVGNISVGGTGKTPLVIAIVEYLRTQGYQPAVVSRGYGGQPHDTPVLVESSDTAAIVGDEPLLIAQRCNVPVAVCRLRERAVAAIEEKTGCDVIISDDGLQYYRMARDLEVVSIDGERLFGNQLLLPAGPLREPLARLQSADFIVSKNPCTLSADYFSIDGTRLCGLKNAEVECDVRHYCQQAVHAVAGIGNPAQFFAMLRTQGLQPVEHIFPDHHTYIASDFHFAENLPIIMTEKDAVKCRQFDLQNAYYLRVSARCQTDFLQRLEKRLQTLPDRDEEHRIAHEPRF